MLEIPWAGFGFVSRVARDGSYKYAGLDEDGRLVEGICASMLPTKAEMRFVPRIYEPQGCLVALLKRPRTPIGYDPVYWDQYAKKNPLLSYTDGQSIAKMRQLLFEEWADQDEPWMNLFRRQPDIAINYWVRWCYLQNPLNN